MFALLKYATWCLTPLAVALIALFAAACGAGRRRALWPALCLTLSFAFLLFMSLPSTVILLGAPLEERFPPTSIATLPKADAIVVLGGGIGRIRPPLLHPELYSAGDRALHAARLYKAGKAPIVIPSGGEEAHGTVPLLAELGVPPAAIVCDDASRNTAENAAFTQTILREKGAKTILLVTSAWHMPRALPQFAAAGIQVIPAATDYEATLFKASRPESPLWRRLPSAEALYANGLYLKEYLGLAFHALKKPSKGAAK